jgi:type IV pilus assembly protein PilC
MALYNWEGKDRHGEPKRGVIDAPSEMEVQNQLRSMGVEPTKIKKKRGGGGAIIIPGFTSVPIKTKVVFTRQLATMIDAGLPLVQCLEILGSQEPHPLFQKIVLDVKRSVESGSTFADALAKHPKVFDNLFVNLIQAGEMGGILDTILNRLAAYIEKAVKLKQKVKSAMKYPVTVLFVSLTISGFLLIKVIPAFGEMFTSMGKNLPALTQQVMKVSAWTVDNTPLLFGIIISVVVSFNILLRYPKPRYYFDAFMLKVPVFGTLIKKAAVAKFTRTLGTLISSGVPILDALEIVAKTAGNAVVEKGVMYTREKISEGKSIASPLMEQPVFPKMVVQMIAVGESTGAMDIMLSKIADFYDDEVDAAVDGITSLIEPLIMVVLGGIIGVVLLAMYMPIFNMADSFS